MKRELGWALLIVGLMAAPASAAPRTTDAGLRSASPRTVALSPQTREALRRWPIQHQGRTKPFDSFARESLRFVTGEPQWRGQDPVITVLSIMAYPEDWQAVPLLLIPFRPLREGIGVAPRTSHISYDELMATRRLMRMLPPIVEKQQEDQPLTMLENETMDAYQRFVSLSALLQHDLALVPSPSGGDPTWQTIRQAEQGEVREAWSGLITALREGSVADVDAAWGQLTGALRSLPSTGRPKDWRLRLEVLYNRLALFRIAQVLYFVAAVGVGLSLAAFKSWASRLGLGVLWAAGLVHMAGITIRVIVGGRPPVSNFYETML